MTFRIGLLLLALFCAMNASCASEKPTPPSTETPTMTEEKQESQSLPPLKK